MFERVILEHESRDPNHLILLGMVGSEPVLVELDNGACLKLGGWTTPEDTPSLVDQNYTKIAGAVARLYDQNAYEITEEEMDIPHILVTALDVD